MVIFPYLKNTAMRFLFLLLLLAPVAAKAQVNRSATELAKENIGEYVTGKLFKGYSYEPVSYGLLKSRNERNRETKWSIVHEFGIIEKQTGTDKLAVTQKQYKFIFFLDEKMKVLSAETTYTD
jgi:hypothetical protein